jgi:hypothetical protein
MAHPHAQTTSLEARPSRFTRVLYAIALGLGALALGSRIVHGVQTGSVEWLQMALPTAVLLALSAIMAGPRRPLLYYPLLVVGAALLVVFYVTPRHGRGPAPAAGAERAR